MTVLVDGSSRSIRTAVALFRDGESRYEMTFKRIVQFSKDEGDSYRVRLGVRQCPPTSSAVPRFRTTHTSSPSTPTVALKDPIYNRKDLQLNEEGGYTHLDSIDTSDLPSALTAEESKSLHEEQQYFMLLQQNKNGNDRSRVAPPCYVW